MATKQNPKKANLLDHHSIKHILDESVTEIVTTKGYPEDVRMSNIRLLIGVIIIVVALFAQFYNKKFPENRNFLIGCIALYPSPGMSLCLDFKRTDGWDLLSSV
ncbi:UNVERIFIED_CONTAM: putative signal peptidase complex subunit 2 [Sesamum indicum]